MAATRLFEANLHRLRRIVECRTVCRHGSPLSRYNNLDLLHSDYRERFGLLGDAVLSFQGEEVLYLTDTGGRWGCGGGANIRDCQPGSEPQQIPASTGELAVGLSADAPVLYLNVHPERWGLNWFDHIYSQLRDVAGFPMKAALKVLFRFLPNAASIRSGKIEI
jgi:hypothetical protein